MIPTIRHLSGRWRAVLGAMFIASLVATVGGVGPTREAAAQPPAAQADLALVPADAAGFVHVRLAELWKHDLLAGVRQTWQRAGEKALATIDKQFVPAPSSLDRLTVFVQFDPKTKEPTPLAVVAFSAPFVPDQVAATYLPTARKSVVGNKTVYTDMDKGLAVTFPDSRHVLIGAPGAVEAYLGKPVAKEGPLAGALKLAATRPVVGAVNVAALPIPPGAFEQAPPEAQPLLKAQLLIASLELGREPRVEVRAAYADAAAAGAAQKAAAALIGMGRKELAKTVKELEDKLYSPDIKAPRPADELPEAFGTVFGLGALGQLDDFLANPNLITRDGNEIAFATTIPKEGALLAGTSAIGIGLLLPAVQKVRGVAARSVSQNNLKQIGIAIHAYHDTYQHFPRDITDKDGKPILSWRVAILPFIEQGALYNKFKMDEPWDGPNNKEWSKALIKTYLAPNELVQVNKEGYALTSYKGVAGPGTIFDAEVKKLSIVGVTDGTSNTVMVVEAGDYIPWAKPGDIVIDPKKPLPKLVSAGLVDQFNALMCDGSVRVVNTKKVSEKTLRAAFSRDGGEVLGPDW